MSVAVALVLLLGLVGSVLDADAQTTPPVTPFPRDLMAFVGPDRVDAATAVDPALAVQSVTVAAGDGIGSEASRVVTVSFAAPVTLPAGAYRVSVVFGSPTGARTRASFEAKDGEATGGTVETSSDGARWSAAGATDATLEGDSLRITAAVGSADPGQGLWVEAQVGEDPARRSQSPVFSLDALLGRTTAGALPAATVGTPTTGTPTVADPLAIPGPPPTLTVDTHLTVTETEPVPTTLAGQPVVNALDEITFMPGYTPNGTVPAVVQINRTTGAISALRGTTGLPTDRTGDGSWIVQGLPVPPTAPSPSAPSTVVLDPTGTAQALGLTLDPQGLALGLRRKFTLADGTDVITAPTMATLVWYETASPTGPPETLAPTTTEEGTASTSSSSSTTTALLVGVAVVALLVVGAVVLVVRRRRAAAIDRWLDDYAPDGPAESAPEPAPAADPGPVLSGDPTEAGPDAPAVAATEAVETHTLDAPRATAPDPVEILTIDRAAAVTAEPGETLTIDAPLVVVPPDTDRPTHDDLGPDDPGHEDAGPDAPGPSGPSDDDAGAGRSPADALAFLEAEVSALSDRVDRIPDRRDDEQAGPSDDHVDDGA